jgi:hypothetical protein
MIMRRTLLIAGFALFFFASIAVARPLKVYILAGQSNMVGMNNASTLEHIKMLPDSVIREYADVFDADGKRRLCSRTCTSRISARSARACRSMRAWA